MRLIDADALCNLLTEQLYTSMQMDSCDDKLWMLGNNSGIREARRIIKSQPTIDPVKHGHWIKDSEFDQNDNAHYHCSVCGRGDTHAKQVVVNYCWGCGSRMDEVENDSQRVD